MAYVKLDPVEKSRRKKEWWANLPPERKEEIRKLRQEGIERKKTEPSPNLNLGVGELIQHLRMSEAGRELERRGYVVALAYSQKFVLGF